MNKETINELERLDKEQLDKVLDYAYLLDEHLYFKREAIRLSKEKEELKQALIDIREMCNKWIYGNEDFCIKTNEDILQIIDKVLGGSDE
ncbi:MAG: hypothetical protein HFH45_01220 [Bacilli bacterium]|jgi:hypothetical protein|nr:hypothetical protein [Bacilli bacterium]